MRNRNKKLRRSKSSRARKRRLAEKQANTLNFETLEPKTLLAAVTVGNATDLSNAPDTSSITALIANDGGDGISLREAITAANNTSGADAITFDGRVFTGGDNNLIRLTQGELVINEGLSYDNLSIDATSVDGVVITGDANGDDVTIGGTNITDVSASFGGVVGAADDFLDDNSRVINVNTPPQSFTFIDNLTLSGLTITGGRTERSGGGIDIGELVTLSLNQITISGNSTTGSEGGGISVGFAYISLTDSTVSGNSAADGPGGGIYARGGSLTVSNSTISGNSTTGDRSGGGGIYAAGGSLVLSNSVVSGNSTTGQLSHGGGVSTLSGDISLINSTVNNNHTAGYLSQGGGISAGENYVYSPGVYTPTDYNQIHLTNSTVSGNSTAGRFGNGGGVRIGYGYLSVTNSLISGNSTSGFLSSGGGISTFGSNVSISNSTFSGNNSTNGGGIHTDGTEITLTNSTVTGNSGSEFTGGILNAGFTVSNFPKSVTLLNSVVAGNVDSGSSPDFFTPADEVDDLTIENSLIGDTTGSNIPFTTSSGNILDQPALLGVLADNGGPTQTHALLPGSPAIDAGSNALAAGLTTDQRGNGFDRIENGTVDIGAFELQAVQTAGQHLFYNNSSFDSADDSAAIATDKVALRNGETATFENYTSYIHGINGIAVDLFSSNGLVASDFQFRFGNSDDVDTFVPLASSTIISLTTVAGAGVNGSDRVLIEFADGAITDGWLQVTVLANASTGLTNEDVFYFGNVIGESGNDATNAIVNLADVGGVRANQTGFGSTDVLNVFDFNRDTRVNLADLAIARTNQSGFTPISLITPTSSSGSPSNKLPPAVGSTASTSVSLPLAVSTLELATPEASTLGLTAPLLAAITVGNATDVSNAPDTSSITALLADDGGDGISLREAIAAANNTFGEDIILFDGSVFTGGNNSVIRLTQGELEISDSVSVDGSFAADVLITADAEDDDVTVGSTNITDVGLSEDASSLDDNSRVINFSSTTGDLTLVRLTITGGRTTDRGEHGGGIRSESSGMLTLINSTVNGNSTQQGSSDGGGIYSSSGDVSLSNSTVSSNSSGDQGGGIFSFGAVSVTRSSVNNNDSDDDGGGIYSDSGDVLLRNSTVNGNNGGRTGGGISAYSGDVSLYNSSVSDNGIDDTAAFGGGIRAGYGDVYISNSTLSGNSARVDDFFQTYTAQGGAISSGRGAVLLVNSTLSGNTASGFFASGGGGIYNTFGTITLLNSTLSGNSGGGIHSDNGDTFLTNSTVTNSTSSGFAGGLGIFTRSGNVSLTNSTVSGSSSRGIITGSGHVSLNYSTVSDNSRGGIHSSSGDISLTNSTLSGNSISSPSFNSGGGISAFSGNVSLLNSTLTGNSTSGAGGGVYLRDDSSSLTTNNSIVAGNFENVTAGNAGTPNDIGLSANSSLTVNHSLIGVTDGLTITGGNNLTGTAASPLDPSLGPLADNGGRTLTHALLPGSPAIGAGSDALAVDENGNPLATDQRGGARVNGTVDIGAFEDQTPQAIQTAGQFIFYNNSGFDGISNSDAIATDKVALRDGETATFENYTSYIHGINGIAVDLLDSNDVIAADFQFKFGNSNDVDTWTTLDSTTAIINLTTVAGAGVNGSDRVFIEFADGAITNGWLQVTVLANSSTGLTNDEVFYFGNAIGETGNSTINANVTLADLGRVRTNQTGFGSTDVLSAFDFNRDARVNLADVGIVRTNQSGFTPIRLITPTDSSAGPAGKLPPAAESTAGTSVSLAVGLLTPELATPNFSSFAVAATIETATTEPANPTEPKETPQRNRLALVGANLDTQSTQQDVLDQVFETTEQENDLANNIPLADIDSLFETNFSAEF